MENCYFQTQNLTVGYDGVPLIRDINLQIARGEIVTLIGPNGSGKSTILKSITRQLRAIAGEVYIDGRELRQFTHRELARRMAVVLTERMRPELMTCRDVVATGRYPYTGRLGLLTPEDEAKVNEAMEAVHALELADRDFDAVSDGQRQRVLLARAICQEPEIILLDEPTSYLDIRHKLELLSILRRMAKAKGITVIMSLHEIDLAQKISDRILCVKGDTLSHIGTPEEIFRGDMVRELYDIERGAYDPRFGSIELPRPEGEPRIFVLSNCGAGIPVYRRLQREDVPFRAGVLCTNDVDYQLARLLAANVIAVEPFQPIGDDAIEQAKAWVRDCARVIDAGVILGPENARLREVIDLAAALDKLERVN